MEDVNEWEIRSTVYLNGRKVGTADVTAERFSDLSWQIGCAVDEGLDTVTRFGRTALDGEAGGSDD